MGIAGSKRAADAVGVGFDISGWLVEEGCDDGSWMDHETAWKLIRDVIRRFRFGQLRRTRARCAPGGQPDPRARKSIRVGGRTRFEVAGRLSSESLFPDVRVPNGNRPLPQPWNSCRSCRFRW
jgi:hypothetical protein